MPKLYGLQMLRAFAAISVLIGHTIAEAEHFFGLSLHTHHIPWTRGVDIFFVISGFIITLSMGRFLNHPAAFFWRRIVRVVPLYYFFTTLMVVTLLAFPSGTKDTLFDLGHVLSSYAFLPFERSDGRIAPVLSLGWTLNYEIFFYAFCGIALFLRKSISWVCAGLILLCALGAIFRIQDTLWIFWTNPILIEFALGSFLAKAFIAGWGRPNFGVALIAFVVGTALLIKLDTTQLPRFIAAGIPATIIVSSGTLFFPKITTRSHVLGDASYALYLSHRFTLRIATLLLLPVLPATIWGAVSYVITVSVLSVSVAILVHFWVERPILRRSRSEALA